MIDFNNIDELENEFISFSEIIDCLNHTIIYVEERDKNEFMELLNNNSVRVTSGNLIRKSTLVLGNKFLICYGVIYYYLSYPSDNQMKTLETINFRL